MGPNPDFWRLQSDAAKMATLLSISVCENVLLRSAAFTNFVPKQHG